MPQKGTRSLGRAPRGSLHVRSVSPLRRHSGHLPAEITAKREERLVRKHYETVCDQQTLRAHAPQTV